MADRLSEGEAEQRLKELHGDWRRDNDTLMREFAFEDFKTAFGFVSGIARLAEGMNHHPDLELGWGRVKVILTTHSAGGLTDNDFRLASQIDDLHA